MDLEVSLPCSQESTFCSQESSVCSQESTFCSQESSFCSQESTFCSQESTFCSQESTFCSNPVPHQSSQCPYPIYWYIFILFSIYTSVLQVVSFPKSPYPNPVYTSSPPYVLHVPLIFLLLILIIKINGEEYTP
jgi:hypothetical protein